MGQRVSRFFLFFWGGGELAEIIPLGQHWLTCANFMAFWSLLVFLSQKFGNFQHYCFYYFLPCGQFSIFNVTWSNIEIQQVGEGKYLKFILFMGLRQFIPKTKVCTFSQHFYKVICKVKYHLG